MVRISVFVSVILLLICGVVPAWAQEPAANTITCSSGTACTKGAIPVFTTAGGASHVDSSIVSQSGTTVKVAGNESVTTNITAGGNVSASGNVHAKGASAFGTPINSAAQEEGFASGSSTEVFGDYGVFEGANTTIGEPPDAGIYGETTSGFGAIGVSDSGQGGTFVSSDSAAGGVPTVYINNISATATDPVFIATGGVVGGECYTDTSGDLTCTGTKSAVVAVDNGTRYVKLYAVESPKNWFEDAGSGMLYGGSAVVTLDSTFAQTVNSGEDYHVFLTPNGECKGLYVSQKTEESFVVRELGGGTSNIAFDYRIMAARKGYENVRFADITKQMKQIKNPPSVYGWSGTQK
jgi:hypothetical protein